jgi:hypothetical protein
VVLAPPPDWQVRVTEWRRPRAILVRRVHTNAFDLRLRRGRYALSVSRPRATCGTAIAPRGRRRLAVVVHVDSARRCSIQVDNTPDTRRTKLVGRPAPRWLLRLARREASSLQDPRPREMRLRTGRVDTIVLRGTFTCAYCHGPPGFLAIGSLARLTVDPRTRIVDSFSLR